MLLAQAAKPCPRAVEGYLRPNRPLARQHPGDAQILVEIGPVDAHGYDLVVLARGGRGVLQTRIPIERRGNLSAVRKHDDELGRREGD